MNTMVGWPFQSCQRQSVMMAIRMHPVIRQFFAVRQFAVVIVALILVGLQTACVTANGALPVPLSKRVADGDEYMGIRLLGTLRLPSDKVKGLTLAGISDLGWDDDEQILYALSDLGRVFHLRPLLQDQRLVDVEIINVYPLQDVKGKRLVKPWKDAEGLTLRNAANGIKGDSELIVCFEVKQRIRRYTSTGKRLGEYPLPPDLRNINDFVNPNISLEAITLHPQRGLLIAPEWPLKGGFRNEVRIYSGADGRHWRYPLYPAAGSALVAMEALADGSLITLERAFVSLTRPLVISLRRTSLPETPQLLNAKPLAVDDIAVFSTSQGWLLDNFEGLTHHQDNRFFIVSDDNRSVLQSTLLVYFELLESTVKQSQN